MAYSPSWLVDGARANHISQQGRSCVMRLHRRQVVRGSWHRVVSELGTIDQTPWERRLARAHALTNYSNFFFSKDIYSEAVNTGYPSHAALSSTGLHVFKFYRESNDLTNCIENHALSAYACLSISMRALVIQARSRSRELADPRASPHYGSNSERLVHSPSTCHQVPLNESTLGPQSSKSRRAEPEEKNWTDP